MNTHLPQLSESKIQQALTLKPMNKRPQFTGFLKSCKNLFLIIALMVLGSQYGYGQEITSAIYNEATGKLIVSGTFASGQTIDVSKLTIKGRGETKNLVAVDDVTSATNEFEVTLNAVDQNYITMHIINKNGTESLDAVPSQYQLDAVSAWIPGGEIDDNNEVTVDNLQQSYITGVVYNTLTGALTATGTAFRATPEANNDIVVKELRFTGAGFAELQSTDQIELTSSTSFSYTLTPADRERANSVIDQAGLKSKANDDYFLFAKVDRVENNLWMPSIGENSNNSENGFINVTMPVPTISSVDYDYSTNKLVVTGTNFYSKDGDDDDIDLSKLTIKGQAGDTRTLTGSVDITSDTSFEIELSGADLTEVEKLINKNGAEAIDETDYNLEAAEDWNNGIGAGVDIVSAMNAITASNVVLDTSLVTSVTVPANKTYKAGDVLSFVVNYDEAVIVETHHGADIPSIVVELESGLVQAAFVSGSETSALTFSYTIQEGDFDTDGIGLGGAIDLNDATIKKVLDGTTDADLALTGVGALTEVKVDGILPTLTSVTISTDNDDSKRAKTGDTITLKFTSSETIATPTVKISNNTVTATYASGEWKAEYLTTSGTAEGQVAISIIFEDSNGNDGVEVTETTDAHEATFDKTAPTLSAVSIESDNSLDDGKVGIGGVVSVKFTADETISAATVTIAGHDISAANTANEDWQADYTMVEGDAAGNVEFSIAFSDLAGNAGTAVTATDNSSAVFFDKTAGTVTAVTSSNPDATYTAGSSVFIDVTFSENVKVTGNPVLHMSTGGTAVYFSDGDGSSNTVGFKYTIVDGEESSDLDYNATTSLDLNSGTIKDVAGNAFTLTLVTPGTTGSISFGKAIVIDAVKPTLVISSNKSTLKKNETAAITFTFSEDPDATFEWNGTTGDVVVTGGALSAIAGSGLTRTATFTPTDNTNNGTVSITVSANTYTDVAGNNGGAGTTPSITFDTNVPTAPAALDLIVGSDTGPVATDNITNDTTPEISGTSEANASITLYIAGSTAVGTASANGSGVWSFSTNTLAEGTHTITAKATDAAGNESAASSTPVIVTVDTTVPTVTSVDVPGNTTYKLGTTLGFTVYWSEAVYTPTGSNLTITLNAPGARTAGYSSGVGTDEFTYNYTVQATDSDNNGIAVGASATGGTLRDLAGNTFSTATLTGVGSTTGVLVDGIVPTLTAVTIASNNTNTAYAKVGNTVTVTFTSSETIQTPTATIATKTATIAGSGTSWTASYDMASGDNAGTVPFSISFTDNAGNAGTAVTGVTSGGGVTFDKTAPAAPSAPNLADADDTGTSNSDNITKTTTPTFTGTAEAGSTVKLYEGTNEIGSVTATGGNYSITSSALITGEYEITAKATDDAGNTGLASTALTLTIDTSAPTITSVTVPANDTYVQGDNLDFTVNWSEDVTNLTGAVIVVNVGGTSRNAVYESGTANTSTFRYTVQNGDNDSDGIVLATAITGATIIDDAGNNAVLTLNSVGATTAVKVDAAVPTLSAVSIASNNANTAKAKTGDLITLSFTSSESITVPTVSIAGHAVTPSHTLNDWTATYTMASGDDEEDVEFSISSFSDDAGNAGSTITTTTNSSSVLFDKTLPVLSSVSILSNNTNTALAKPGNIITVNFTSSETLQTPTATIAGHSATVTSTGVNTWKADYTLAGTEDDGDAEFSITFKDLANNAGASPAIATTNSSAVEINNSVPQLTLVTIESDNDDITKAKTGDEITINFTADKEIVTPVVTIANQSATVSVGVGTNEWVAKYTFTGSGEPEGTVAFKIEFEDLASNEGVDVTTTTNSSTVSYDKTLPTFSAVTIASNNSTNSLAKVGDVITLSFTSSETITNPTVSIASHAVTPSAAGNNWTATYTMVSGDTEAAVAFSISSFNDAAGNAGATRTTTTNSSSVTFDKTVPTLSSVTIASNNATTTLAKPGNTITVNFTSSETVQTPAATIAGHSATVSSTGVNTWKAVYTLAGTEDNGNAVFSISFKDLADNAGTDVASTTNSSAVEIDNSVPQLTLVTIKSDNVDITKAKTGNKITINFTANKVLTTPVVTIASQSATVAAGVGTNEWVASYTLTGTETQGLVAFKIEFEDLASNEGVDVTATTNSSTVTYDRSAPTLSNVHIESDGDVDDDRVRVGEEVELVFTSSEAIKTPVVTISGHSAVVEPDEFGGPNDWIAFYDMASGDSETSSVPFTIDFTDLAGNAGTTVTATSDMSAVLFDKTVPTVTAVTSSTTDDTYGLSEDILIEVEFSEDVTVDTDLGTPTLTLNSGGTADYSSGSSSSTLVFKYTVVAGNSADDLDYSSATALTLNGGSIKDHVGNDAVLTLAAPGAAGSLGDNKDLVIDAVGPVLSSVIVESDNAIPTLGKTGNKVILTFTANEPINTPTVKIRSNSVTATNTGGNEWEAEYTILSSDAEGVVDFNIEFEDILGNDGTAVTATTNSSSVEINRSNAKLKNIVLSSGDLNPVFSSGTESYTTTVLSTISAVNITPTLDDITAFVKVNGASVSSGIASSDIELNNGETKTITLVVTAENGTTNKTYKVEVTRLTADEIAPDEDGNVAPTSEKPNVVVTSNTQPLTVNMPSGPTVEPVKVDFSLFLTTVLSIIQVQVPEFKVVPSSPTGVSLAIPQTRIESSNPNWSGVILAPTVTTYTIPAKPGVVAKEGLVIEVGDPNFGLSLDKAARLVFPGQKGKAAAFVHNGKYIEITKVGLTDTQAEGDALGKDEAYRIDVGNDLIVWTKAFSKFLTFEESVDLDVAVVASDLALLTADGIKGANIDLNNITAKLDVLPSTMTGGSTVTWSSSDPALLSSDGQTINRPTSGTATVTLTAIVRKGAVTQTKTFTLILLSGNQAPTLAAIANQALCYTTTVQTIGLTGITPGSDAGQTTTLSVSSSNPGLFSSLSVTGTGSTGTVSYVTGNPAGGTATITVTVRDNGGTGNGGVDTFTRTFTITVNPAPAITITSNLGTSISKGLTAVLSATGGTTYTWANASGIVSGQNSPILTVRPTANTTYTVTVTNATGCVSTQTFNLIVNEDYQALDINNLMSPNGDGVNDKLVIKNLDMYPNNTVKIFDRAGRLLYQKVNYTNDWDGTFQGAPLTNDTYFYVVDFGAGMKQIRGFVSIINQ